MIRLIDGSFYSRYVEIKYPEFRILEVPLPYSSS
jgi:hypothetical protein